MSGFGGMGKLLIFAGSFLILLGLFFTFWQRLPFLGRLPGDIIVRKGSFQLFFPLLTCLVISLVLTILVNMVFRLFR